VEERALPAGLHNQVRNADYYHLIYNTLSYNIQRALCRAANCLLQEKWAFEHPYFIMNHGYNALPIPYFVQV
jgi:hypothetical protein